MLGTKVFQVLDKQDDFHAQLAKTQKTMSFAINTFSQEKVQQKTFSQESLKIQEKALVLDSLKAQEKTVFQDGSIVQEKIISQENTLSQETILPQDNITSLSNSEQRTSVYSPGFFLQL